MSREYMNGEDGPSAEQIGKGVVLTPEGYKKANPFADVSPRAEEPLKILTPKPEAARPKTLPLVFKSESFDPSRTDYVASKEKEGTTSYIVERDPKTGEIVRKTPEFAGGAGGAGVEAPARYLEIRKDILDILAPPANNYDAVHDYLTDLIEEGLRGAEEGEIPFEERLSRSVSETYSFIDQALQEIGDRELQIIKGEIGKELTARFKYRNASYNAANNGGETFTKDVLNIYQEEHELILGKGGKYNRHQGTRGALAVWESNDGELIRGKPSNVGGMNDDMKRLIERQVDYVKAAAPQMRDGAALSGYSDAQLKDALEKVQKGIRPESALQAVDGAVSREAQRAFYELIRDWRLAKDMMYNTMTAVDYDGPREKGTGSILGPQEVILDIVNRRGEQIRINLADPEEVKNKKGVLDDLRKSDAGYQIGMAWDRAWREFYRDNYDRIDVETSASGGNAPNALRREAHFPVYISRPANPNKGRAEYLRRYTYANVQSLARTMGVASTADVVDNFHYATYYHWGGRVNGADKFRKLFAEDGPKLIDDPNSMSAADLKPLSEMRAALAYVPAEEQREVMAFLLDGLLKQRMKYMKKDFNARNITAREAEITLFTAKSLDLIDKDTEDRLAKKAIGWNLPGPLWKIPAFIRSSWGAGNKWEALSEFFKKLFEAILKP